MRNKLFFGICVMLLVAIDLAPTAYVYALREQSLPLEITGGALISMMAGITASIVVVVLALYNFHRSEQR